MHPKTFSSRLAAVLLTTMLGFAATADAQNRDDSPAPDDLCALHSETFRVDLLRVGYCCPNVLEFWVGDDDGGRRVAVETGIGRPGRMTLTPDDKVLVGGTLGRGARALVIVDVASGALQDELHSFDFRVSPSERRVVYSRRFAHDAPENERRSLVLLYDLSKDAAENRSGSPATLDIANAGVPIYPEANAAEGSYQSDLESPHLYLSPFLWSDDETRIVFFEHHDVQLRSPEQRIE